MENENIEKMKLFENQLYDLISFVELNLDKNPKSELGISIGEQAIKLISSLKGNDLDFIRLRIWEKGFNSVKMNIISPEAENWVGKAMDAYWRQCLSVFT